MTENNGEFKGETNARLDEIFRILARMDSERSEARVSTHEWQTKIEERLEDLNLWRAKVIGYAAGVSFVVALIFKMFESR